MNVADAMSLALAEDNVRLRARFPKLFARVDAITSQPDWRPFIYVHDVKFGARIVECAWCGNDFPLTGRPLACCSLDCRHAYGRWRRDRGAKPPTDSALMAN